MYEIKAVSNGSMHVGAGSQRGTLLFVCSRVKSENPRLVLVVRGLSWCYHPRVLVRLVRVDRLGIVVWLSTVKAYFDSLISQALLRANSAHHFVVAP